MEPPLAYTFTIPSVYDGSQLDCRVSLPRELLQPERVPQWKRRGAIVAHPYASLGGCYDDPVVHFLGEELLQAGYVVGTFNFRGAGDSDGRTSWTGRPEIADYVSFYGFMVLYLHFLGPGNPQLHEKNPDRPSGSEPADFFRLVLGGYSYGSMIASHLPAVEAVVELFTTSVDGRVREIARIAREASGLTKESSNAQNQEQSPSYGLVSSNGKDQPAPLKAEIAYLLMSPLLPPINQFLTLFSKAYVEVGSQGSAHGRQIPCPKAADQLCAHRTLAIYGTNDTFTAASKLQKWSSDLSHKTQSRFHSVEVDGAGHFWREDSAESQARGALREWLSQMP